MKRRLLQRCCVGEVVESRSRLLAGGRDDHSGIVTGNSNGLYRTAESRYLLWAVGRTVDLPQS